MYESSLTHITILHIPTGQYRPVWALNPRPYIAASDPAVQHTHAFPTMCQSTPETGLKPPHQDPKSHFQARHYPDSSTWDNNYNSELGTLDDHGTIEWMLNNMVPPPTRLILLKMTYRYKHVGGTEPIRKARSFDRGDMMKPGTHYDLDHTLTYMAENPCNFDYSCPRLPQTSG